MAKPPAEIGRNKFDEWCWRRGLDLRGVSDALRQGAIALGRDPKLAPSIETVRLIRLPFTDPRRRVPAEPLIALIYAWTGGEIIPADFYPPQLQPGPPSTSATPAAARVGDPARSPAPAAAS